MGTKQVLFTDLDGTLIDFASYDGSATRARLRNLVAGGVAVVFCSSKTLAEQRALMQWFEVTIPAIFENGAGIFIPTEYLPMDGCAAALGTEVRAVDGGCVYGFGAAAAEILAALEEASARLHLSLGNYRSLDVAEVARRTGLSQDAAARARLRDFSETLTAPLDGGRLEQLNILLAGRGLHAVCGGRFHTVTSQTVDKGSAVRWLLQRFAEAWPQSSIESMAIGDAANDLPMLREVDQPCLVQRHDGLWNELDVPGLHRIPAIGPLGWLQAVSPLSPCDDDGNGWEPVSAQV